MGRRIQITVPQVVEQLTPHWSYLPRFQQQNREFKEKQQASFNQRHKVREQQPILPNTEMWITSGEEPVKGKVVTAANTPRSYLVSTPAGDVRRNRSQLRVVPTPSTSESREEQVNQPEQPEREF